MLGKLLGGNKKPKYFLELGDQKNGSAAPQEAAKTEVKTEAPKQEPAKSEASATKKAEPAKVEKKVAAKVEKTVAAIAEKAVAAAPAQAPAPVKPATPANNGRASTPTATNFATDYLLPKPTTSRRRPGPSLNMFRDMARQVGRR